MQNLTVTQAAKVLQVTPLSMRILLCKGRIPGAFKIGTGPCGRWRIPESALELAQKEWAKNVQSA